MRFVYGRQDMTTLRRAQANGFLLTNGRGGYMAVSAAFSVTRCDQGLLAAAVVAPNDRRMLVHRLRETLTAGGRTVFLSAQGFADGRAPERGDRLLSQAVYEAVPEWTYDVCGVQVTRTVAMADGENACAVLYTLENRSDSPCTLRVTPMLRLTPKEQPLAAPRPLAFDGRRVTADGSAVQVQTDGVVTPIPQEDELLAYPDDAKDGRPDRGWASGCLTVHRTVAPGEACTMELVFSQSGCALRAGAMIDARRRRAQALMDRCGFDDPLARELALSADAFIARRDSTGGQTVVAGYPLFGDWGRDTMIALPGLTLATGRFDDARSILRTFLAYEKDGLVPNLFPEGSQQPMYNTADAALLLIDCVWQLTQRTGDAAFAAEAYPVMERIVGGYMRGTHHAIRMEPDGLIAAGEGLDQVTWMDVCVEGILPTPRHGKPVEINAYWYNALRIMEALAPAAGRDGAPYGALAERVRRAFVKAFYIEARGYLRDVVSGTAADEQIRCNQLAAVTMPFTMLTPEQARSVVDTVYRHLYTPCGLRTLSPQDRAFHAHYGGAQKKRDLAYHQGTVWVFPLADYLLAELKTQGNSPEAVRRVRASLAALEPMLREGCAGQLPEIYDGGVPGEGKGCFAQAWSVGGMLRVFDALRRAETGKDAI